MAVIVFWVVAVRLVGQTAFWEPRVVEVGGVSYLPDQRPMGFMVFLCLLAGVGIGATLPSMIQDWLPTGHAFYPPPLDGLGRLASIVGGVCGAYVGVRGSRLWVVLGLACGGIYVVRMALDYVLGGF
ncbi:MAG: hypothetical protein ACRYG8_36530 [Janthinobacterium lividum]